jgi:hypothetical protein
MLIGFRKMKVRVTLVSTISMQQWMLKLILVKEGQGREETVKYRQFF